MDEYYSRQKHARYKPPKVRKNNGKRKNKIRLTLVMQLVISIIVFMFVWLIGKSDSPAGKFIVKQVKWVVSKDVRVDDVYASLKNTVSGLAGKDAERADDYVGNNDTDIEDLNENEAYPAFSNVDNSGKEAINEADKKSGNTGVANSVFLTDADGEKIVADLPVRGVIISPFGTRINQLKNMEEFHNGIDIEAAESADVYSIMEGKVIDRGSDRKRGIYVKIDHGDEVVGVYAHLEEVYVKKGQNIDKTAVIGNIQNPGGSSGPHIHFEILKKGQHIDPEVFLREIGAISSN